jgi:hypothetical protein
VAVGKQSVALADRSGDAFQRITKRAALADVLHQAGRWEESKDTFRQAGTLQAEDQPKYPILYSFAGYRYSDTIVAKDSRGPSGRMGFVVIHPGHRPAASALGWTLPARWAGALPRG